MREEWATDNRLWLNHVRYKVKTVLLLEESSKQ